MHWQIKSLLVSLATELTIPPVVFFSAKTQAHLLLLALLINKFVQIMLFIFINK